VSGFPNKVIALQFEWQWQNSQRSRVTKKRKSIEKNKKGGFKVSLKVLHSLLRTPLWEKLNLKVHFLDNEKKKIFEKFFEDEKNNRENEEEGSGRGGKDFSSIMVNTQLNTASDLEGMHLNSSDGMQYYLFEHVSNLFVCLIIWFVFIFIYFLVLFVYLFICLYIHLLVCSCVNFFN
jgi:hypothetical protein